MGENLMELVYLSLQGELAPECAIADVEDVFVEGGSGAQFYQNARNAYKRVCARLGNTDNDPDLDDIIRNMESLEKEIAFRMYQYGAKFGMR